MKVTVEIDCTPEEAREFLGLPDVRPMQSAVMDHMQAHMTEAADRLSPDGLLRSWLTFLPQMQEPFRDMMSRFAQAGGSPPSGSRKEPG